MSSTSDALPLVHEGWDHLKHERPLAAWASWQRALRIDPDQPAARQALDRLKDAEELPAAARKEYRFRNPSDPDRRARWDAAFRDRDLAELADAASVFEGLSDADPTDADAFYNRALCLAWLGRNAEAIGCLDESVGRCAVADFEGAVNAWKLAGILRTGGGAEGEAEVYSHAIDLSDQGDPAAIRTALAGVAHLRRLPIAHEVANDVTVDEWLDRPWPEQRAAPLRLDEVPRVLAVVYSAPRTLKLSLPDHTARGEIYSVLRRLRIFAEWEKGAWSPLPLARLDAAVWTIRPPAWADETTRTRLYRENVEDYYENRWINRPLGGLGDLTPLEAARRAIPADLSLMAKLEAAVGLREELAERPPAAGLYQGYPFDRLRHRLGLAVRDDATVGPLEYGCMTADELGRIDPASLDDEALADAFRSASALGDCEITARFSRRLVETRSPSLGRLDLAKVFGPLITRTECEERPAEVLRLVDGAITIDERLQEGRHRAFLLPIRAELHARVGDPDRAESTYREMVDHSAAAASIALDGAETLLDNGHDHQGRRLAALARDLALEHGDVATAREAEGLLGRFEP